MFIWCKIKFCLSWKICVQAWSLLFFFQGHRYPPSYNSKIDHDVKMRANLLTTCVNEQHAQLTKGAKEKIVKDSRFYRAAYLVVQHYIFKMSTRENDEPPDVGYCEAVRIGRHEKEAELTIFYTPKEGSYSLYRAQRVSWNLAQYVISNRLFASPDFEVHNGYLAGKVKTFSYGRWYWSLTIVTSRGKIIDVRRYDDAKSGEGEFLSNLLTVLNEQCWTVYISFAEFVINTAGYWLKQKDAHLT